MESSAGGTPPQGPSSSADVSGHPVANVQLSGLSPRIGPQGFTAGIFAVLTISILTILARVALRLQRSRSLAQDDYFLIVALVTLIGACVTQHYYRDIMYMTINVETGNQVPPITFSADSVTEAKVLDATSVLLWTSIFCVKFSFLVFFRKLITRIRPLQIYWWVVFALVLPSALVCIPLGFIECAYFGEDLLAHCPVDWLIAKEHVYLNVTTVLDIFTDVLIVSLPVALLWNVRIDFAKKVTLIGMFGLSVVMIIIALIRVTLAPLTPTIMDTALIFFLQILEAGIALVMVSVSAFRGLFGQGGAPQGYSKGGLRHAQNLRNHPDAEKAGQSADKAEKALKETELDNSTVRNQTSALKDAKRLATERLIDVTPQSTTRPSVANYEMTTVSRCSKSSTALRADPVSYDQQQDDLQSRPTAITKGVLCYDRANSPNTTRCWSENPSQDSGLSSPIRAEKVMEKVRRIRARSRAPSLGEVLIEEREGATPKDYV